MENKIYPNLVEMCRLCLKENAGTVSIFPIEKRSDNKYAALSIPMRIMACAALEVQCTDDFPKKICMECRLQLEKSYYFRKQSQASDAKLRKHFRLICMGKTSKVFVKKTDEDDEDDELEFQETLNFIKEQEEHQKQLEKLKFDTFMNELKAQTEQDLKQIKENLAVKCREDLTPQIREQLKNELIPEITNQVKNELRIEVENELEEQLRKEISEQCLSEAKESIRNEVFEECRTLEIKCILDDLQSYLNNKKKTLDSAISIKDIGVNNPLSPTNSSKETAIKIKHHVENAVTKESEQMEIDLQNQSVEKSMITEDELNLYDGEGNFLIYDTDDTGGDDKNDYVNKDLNETEVQYEVEDYIDSHATYEKINEEYIEDNNDETGRTSTTTSYRIEDNENGEIKFLKKSNEKIDIDDLSGNLAGENIMVINFPENIETEYVEQFEEVKCEKAKNTKTKKSPKKKPKSTGTRLSSTFETNFIAKTYVNPLQRCTDTPKIFKCNGCPTVFSTKPSLERHLRSHQKVEKTGITFQCQECRIVVSCASALRRHMYVHCDQKPFSCNICEKAFVQKEILKRHMQTHTGIKPHKCTHCDRSFAQRINLTQHVNRTHLPEPHIQYHSCHLCPKRFNHASGLSRHLATHSGVSFQCSECDRTFGDRSSVKRHIVSMHSDMRVLKEEIKLNNT